LQHSGARLSRESIAFCKTHSFRERTTVNKEATWFSFYFDK